MGTKRWTRIAAVVATCMGSMGVSLVAGAPAGAATAALYAYAGGTKASGVCVSTTTPSGQCSLQHALALATPIGAAIRTIDLATAGSNVGTVGDPSHYTGNWAVLLTHTASATPLVIQAAPGLATAPILDGDGGGIATPCETPVGAPDCSGAILTITGPGYLTVSGITLANANNTATGNGGGIDNGDTGPGGTITVLSSTFTNLIAACDGGAIDNADNTLGTGTVTITGSTFSSDSAGCDGGAIDSSDNGGSGGLSVTSSTFTSDSAGSDGGAIDSADYSGTGTLAVTGSTFTSDTAVGSGGAINNAGNGGTGNGATVATSSFSLNSSTSDNGGAIDNADYAGTGTMAVTGSSFISDTAAFDGGAIDSADNGGIAGISHLTVSGSTFTSNSAAYDGGAIDNADSSGTGTLGVASSTFTLNTAGSDGGAIDNADTSGTGSGASVTTSTFTSNTASTDGGAIDNADFGGAGPGMTITGSTFSSNIATTNDGGAIDNADNGGTATLAVATSTFAGNAAAYNGGAIDNADSAGTATLAVSTSTFAANSATVDGGAIDNADDASTTAPFGSGTLSVVASTLVGNTATSGGGAGIATVTSSATGVGSVTVAGDQLADACGQNTGTWVDLGSNVGDPTCLQAGPGNVPDAVLASVIGPLADNGGPTQTMQPLSGNPGIGLIANPTAVSVGGASLALCPTTDQRGTANTAGTACYAGSVQGPPDTLAITSAPLSITASASATAPITVTVHDHYGNPVDVLKDTTVHLASTSANGTFAAISGGPLVTSVVIPTGSSAATAYYGDRKAGTPTITVAATGLTSGAQAETVTAGTASKLIVTTQPVGGVIEGTAFTTQPIVSVEDANGNVVTTDTSNVVLAISTYSSANGGTTQGTLACTNTGGLTNAAVSGVATYTGCNIAGAAGAGSYVLSATDGSLTSTTTSSVSITAGTATKVVYTTSPPSIVAAGTTFSVVAAEQDTNSNTLTTDSSTTVSLTSSGGFSCTTTPTKFTSGIATFSRCSFTTASGTAYTVTAASGSLTSAVASTTVSAATVNKLVITSTAVSGAAGSSANIGPITVQEQDSYGNPTTTAETVNLSSNSTGTKFFAATSGGTSTSSVSIAASSSSTTFYYADTKAGTPTITTSASGVASGTQIEQIVPGAATRLSVVAPATVAAGTPTTVSVTAQDAFANTAVGYAGTVRLTSTDGAASLPGPYAYRAGDHGVHAFSVTFGSGSTRTVTGIDTVTSSITGTSGTITVPAPPPPPPPPVVVPSHGYWLVGADGGIFTFGAAQFHGSTGDFTLQRPVVGITPTSDRNGYWLVATDGGIFAFGDAGFHGSIPGIGLAPAGTVGAPSVLAAPIVAMVPSNDGGGYFMVAADGGVFAFGDAQFAGSCPSIGGCSGAAVAVMPDASGRGYWLVTALGNVYSFGDAASYGSPGTQGSVVTSAQRAADGQGYWILFANGTVTAFGSAVGRGGPTGAVGAYNPATAIFATADGSGYWVAAAGGGVFTYGSAPFDGDMSGAHLNSPIIAASGW